MTNKTELLNQLFFEWENNVDEYKDKFIKDGIIDEALYDEAPIKILFIAKEPNDNEQEESWDFRNLWQEEPKHIFSYRLAEWSYGIFNEFPQYDKIWKDAKEMHKALKSVAFMNIKKSGGGGNSEYEKMMKHLLMNLDFLHQQIDIISPDIIILGTSWNELRNELFPNVKWDKSGYNLEIAKYKKATIIDFYHPSSRIAPAASYSLLQNVINSNLILKP